VVIPEHDTRLIGKSFADNRAIIAQDNLKINLVFNLIVIALIFSYNQYYDRF
jgi:hypothetical protein